MGSNNRSSRPKGRRLGCPHLPTRLWTAVLLLAGCVLPVVYILLLTPVPDGSQGTPGVQRTLPFEQNVEHAHARGRDHRHNSRKDKPHRAPSSKAKEEEMEEVVGGCVEADCPTVERVTPSNGGAAGGTLITVTGFNLGAAEQVSVGAAACTSFQRLSATSLTCVVPAGSGVRVPVVVVVRTEGGFKTSNAKARWSYDLPRVDAVQPNHAPAAGGTVVTLRGLNFGASESFPIASLGGVPCQSTQWLSDEAVTCVVPKMLKTPPRGGVRVSVHVTTCGCGDAAHTSSSFSLDDDEDEEKQDDEEAQERARSRPPVLFSYDEAIVKQEAAAVLRGLPFKVPHMPLTLNAKQLTGDHTYELTFVDPVANRRRYFAVSPELAGVLPTDDFRHRYDSCAVVGNSGMLTGAGLGAIIDDHDAVFRFHHAPLHRFETDVGVKTSFQVLDQYWLDTLMANEAGPLEAKWWAEDATLLLWSPFSQEAFTQLRQLYPTSSIALLSRNLLHVATSAAATMRARLQTAFGTPFPTHAPWQSSMWYTLHFAMHVCGELDVYGMDVRDGKFHYYEDHDPGQQVRDAQAQELLMLLVLQQGGYVHRLAPHSAPSLAANAPEQGGEEEEEDEEEQGSGKLEENEEDRGDGGAIQCKVRECVNDCSHNGWWTNGSCACEPIYAGADCSVNLMHKAAAQLLAGLQLRYTGPMALNKQEVNGSAVNGGFIALPKGITHQKLREGDTYRVDRQLYAMLPDYDLNERFATCAIVGNSGSMLKHKHGRAIDAHDLVYRFNQGPVRGFEQHVGSRSTYESLNGFWVKELLDDRRGYRWNWRSRDTGLLLFELFEPWAFIWKTKTQIVDKDKWWKGAYMKLRRTHPERKVIALSPQFVSWSYLLYRELRRRFQRMRLGHYPGEKPMSGFFAFFFTLQLCDQVDVYGFAPWKEAGPGQAEERYHYFDSARPRPGSHSFDLATYIYQLMAMQHDHVHIHS